MKFERRETVRGFADKAGIAVSTMTRLREMESPDEMYPATLQQVIAALGWTIPEFNDWWRSVQSADTQRLSVTIGKPPDQMKLDFTVDEYDQLQQLAVERDTTIPDLIVQALREKYIKPDIAGKIGGLPNIRGVRTASDPDALKRGAAKSGSTQQRLDDEKDKKKRGN